MFNLFKRLPADPSIQFDKMFLLLSDKRISRIYSQKTGDPDVKGISGFDSVVRLNSTYLELVDRNYRWRGTWTLAGAFFFCLVFIGTFLSLIVPMLWEGGYPLQTWIYLIVIWCLISLPLSWVTYRIMASEAFFSTYYPIRFNRINRMVYVYQSGGTVLSVPWRDIHFVLTGGKVFTATEWTIVGCITEDDGDAVIGTFPLPINLDWDPEDLTMYWEFIRCYMEERDEYLPDLVDTIHWCPPVEKQKEGWLFGLFYLYKQYVWQGLIFNLPLFPLVFLISITRRLVMATSKIPVWPAEVVAACQPAADDPVNKGAEHNPPQVWRPMLGLQGKARYAQSFARERGAMDRIVSRLKEKYGKPGEH
ncbi:DUF6708 domain-containing protein [Dryocola clanedunensis]|uniref:DUF6708 domain-containing protein n=1 Tax=Cedecea sulfonylureivorans TaxID=3051154 RepID=UPI001928624B|nr:DUF6708 domain-containing protein [Cedecea sulfonylureivorans]